MKKEMNNLKKAKKQMLEQIPIVLNETIIVLKKLVDDGVLYSFSFLQNDIYWYEEKPIYVAIDGDGIKDIRLGVVSGTKFTKYCNDKKIKINDDTKVALKELNANLVFLNENFIKDLHQINKTTWFSVKNLNKEESFSDGNVPLLPDFSIKEDKKKQKKKM